MQHWRAKVETFTRPRVTCDGLVVFSRAGSSTEAARAALAGLRCEVEFVEQPAHVSRLSSHQARVGLVEAADAWGGGGRAFQQRRRRKCLDALAMPDVLEGRTAVPDAPDVPSSLHGVLMPSVARMCLSDPGLLDAYRRQIISDDPAARE